MRVEMDNFFISTSIVDSLLQGDGVKRQMTKKFKVSKDIKISHISIFRAILLLVLMSSQNQPWYEKPGPVFALVGVLFIGGFFSVVVWRTFAYYQNFQKGGNTPLPQFSDKFTPGNFKTAAAKNQLVDVTSQDAPTIGNANAAITIVEFGDFECPYTKDAYPAIRQLAAENPNLIRYEWRDYPLDTIHTHASATAVAASCAQKQGKFWQMQDKIFTHQDSLERNDFLNDADQIGLDKTTFTTCLDAGGDAKRLATDRAVGDAQQIRGTPTFYINGARVEGAVPYAIWQQILQKLSGK